MGLDTSAPIKTLKTDDTGPCVSDHLQFKEQAENAITLTKLS